MPTIQELETSLKQTRDEYAVALKKLAKQYIIDKLDTYAVEIKACIGSTEVITTAKFSYEDEYNDESGTYAYLQNIYLYDANDCVVDLDFGVETRWGTEDFDESLRELIRDKFDVEELRNLIGDPTTIKLID